MERARAEAILQQNFIETDNLCEQMTGLVGQYVTACVDGREKEAEDFREQALILQGRIMDNLATNLKLLRQLGLPLPDNFTKRP